MTINTTTTTTTNDNNWDLHTRDDTDRQSDRMGQE